MHLHMLFYFFHFLTWSHSTYDHMWNCNPFKCMWHKSSGSSYGVILLWNSIHAVGCCITVYNCTVSCYTLKCRSKFCFKVRGLTQWFIQKEYSRNPCNKSDNCICIYYRTFICGCKHINKIYVCSSDVTIHQYTPATIKFKSQYQPLNSDLIWFSEYF